MVRIKIVFLLLFVLTLSKTLHAQNMDDYDETRGKVLSIFMYNFGRYVQWPGAYEVGDFDITVYKPSTGLEKKLNELSVRKKIDGRQVVINTIESFDNFDKPNILYIPSEYANLIAEAENRLNGKAVLIVTHNPNGLENGGDINFILKNGRYRYAVNKTKIESKGMEIAGSLLSLATQIK